MPSHYMLSGSFSHVKSRDDWRTTAMTRLSETQTLYYQDLSRLRGKRGQLLELLLDDRWHPTAELAEVAGLTYSSSISALRREGWRIVARPASHGVWEYRLHGKGTPPSPRLSRPQQVIASHYTHAIQTRLGGEALCAIRDTLPQWMYADPQAPVGSTPNAKENA